MAWRELVDEKIENTGSRREESSNELSSTMLFLHLQETSSKSGHFLKWKQ